MTMSAATPIIGAMNDRHRIRSEQALAWLAATAQAHNRSITQPLDASYGSILADPVIAARAVPGFDNAAVDGYAFRHVDLPASDKPRLALAATTIYADSSTAQAALEPQTIMRIFTGGQMPEGADSVIMQEDVSLIKEHNTAFVVLNSRPPCGANRRRAGEDIATGTQILSCGTRLHAQDIAAAASLGRAHLRCFEPVRIGLISTGNEITAPGAVAGHDAIFDSNYVLLKGLLRHLPATISAGGIVPDDDAMLRDKLSTLAENHDLIVLSGGVSRGDADKTITAIQSLGQLDLWQLAIKPGRPMAIGRIGKADRPCWVVGLPGNPVAAMVCCLIYAHPLILALGGSPWWQPRRFPFPARFTIENKKPDRREFLRGRLHIEPTDHADYTDHHAARGKMSGIELYPRVGSGLISSLRFADGLIDLAEDRTNVVSGTPVDFIPFSEFTFF